MFAYFAQTHKKLRERQTLPFFAKSKNPIFVVIGDAYLEAQKICCAKNTGGVFATSQVSRSATILRGVTKRNVLGWSSPIEQEHSFALYAFAIITACSVRVMVI